MARHEADREDIMREAIALRRRIAIELPGVDEPIVCGVRNTGSWSFYLDPNRVYQFDEELRLRRAYVTGFLYRTQGTTLARMHRERSETETTLVRNDLDPEELAAFLAEMRTCFATFLNQLHSEACRVIESIPDDGNVQDELHAVLEQMLNKPIELASAIKARR